MLCASYTVVYTVSYGLTRSLTVLYDRLYDYTRTLHPCQFFKSFKNHTRFTRIHSNGPSVSRIRPRFIRLYVRFTRVANRVNRVFCVRRALGSPQGVMPSRLYLPRSLYDFSVCDFAYDILDIVSDNGLRGRCLQFNRASNDFLYWLSSMFRVRTVRTEVVGKS